MTIVLYAEQLRLMTFNYQESVNIPFALNSEQQKKNKENPIKRELATALLKDYKPDIIAFQEPHLGDLEFFKEKLGNYAWIGKPVIPLAKQNKLKVAATLGKAGSDYNAIFYNKNKFNLLQQGTFWLNETMKEGEPSAWTGASGVRRYFHIRACTWGQFQEKSTKQKFWVFNTHLSLDAMVANRELELIKTIIAQKSGSEPVFVVGDWNKPRPEVVLGEGFYDTRNILAKKEASIDHIFLKNIPSKNVRAYKVIDYTGPYTKNNIRPSDHRPIYADVFLAK